MFDLDKGVDKVECGNRDEMGVLLEVGFNRYIVECKWRYRKTFSSSYLMVLIGTLWNVNLCQSIASSSSSVRF